MCDLLRYKLGDTDFCFVCGLPLNGVTGSYDTVDLPDGAGTVSYHKRCASPQEVVELYELYDLYGVPRSEKELMDLPMSNGLRVSLKQVLRDIHQ